MKLKLKEMLVLQDKLNNETNWDNWKLWVTNKWRVINWKRCMYMELAEAIDSVIWKHWKNLEWEMDYENFKIEIVDIWHFVMSETLIHIEMDELVDIMAEYSNIQAKFQLPVFWKKEDFSQIDNILEPYENLMALSLLKLDDKMYLKDLIQTFFMCMNSAWISFEELYDLYIWKNVLNKFRQDHWYKEWTYIKVWNWDEDNVVMQKILKDTKGFWEIYKKLEEVYITL